MRCRRHKIVPVFSRVWTWFPNFSTWYVKWKGVMEIVVHWLSIQGLRVRIQARHYRPMDIILIHICHSPSRCKWVPGNWWGYNNYRARRKNKNNTSVAPLVNKIELLLLILLLLLLFLLKDYIIVNCQESDLMTWRLFYYTRLNEFYWQKPYKFKLLLFPPCLKCHVNHDDIHCRYIVWNLNLYYFNQLSKRN